MSERKKFYRYEMVDIAPGYRSVFSLKLTVFESFQETPEGYWICHAGTSYPVKSRWIKKRNAIKKYARETPEKALACYIYRTKKRIGYLKISLSIAEKGLEKALLIQKEKDNAPMQ